MFFKEKLFVLFMTLGINSGQNNGASSYSNQVNGRFKDDFFITNLLAKDFLRSQDFLRRDAQFSPPIRNRWSSSYDPSPLYASRYYSTKINEIPITQDDEEEIAFSYDEKDLYGPQNWGAIDKNCDGSLQSPIDLSVSLSRNPAKKSSLNIEGFTSKPSSVTISNNGHSAVVKLNLNKGKIMVSGGPLDTPYILDNVHWHWGDTDEGGSEHTLHKKRYSAEAHFVTYSSVYGSITEAMTKPKGLAVLGFLYKLDNKNQNQNPFVSLLSKIIEPNSQYIEKSKVFTMKDLIKSKSFEVLSYKGSLTTPGCFESVTWMVSTTPLSISSADLAELRKLKNDHGKLLTKNFRPLKLNNRRSVNAYKITVYESG